GAIVRKPLQPMRGGRHLMPSTTATHAGTCRLWLVGVLLHALAGAAAAEPALTVATGGRTAIYTVAGLLGLPAATTVTIPAGFARKRARSRPNSGRIRLCGSRRSHRSPSAFL